MIIDRGERPRAPGDRPIIYSSATLTLCGSPPASPSDPFRSPLRRGCQQQLPSSQPPAASTPTTFLSPMKPAQAQTPVFSPQKSPMASIPSKTPLENMHLAKIKELEARIEELTESATTATAAAEKTAALEAEWRSKALEAEATLAQYTAIEVEDARSQRSKLVEELKSEAALWRRKFDELLEEHAALQSRLESATAQVSLLDKALNTVRGDTADALAALETAELLSSKKTEEFEAYKKEKEAIVAEAVNNAAEKEKEKEVLVLENKNLSVQVGSLNQKVENLLKAVENLEKENREKAAPVQTPVLKDDDDGSSGNSKNSGGDSGRQLKVKDINTTTNQIREYYPTEKEKVVKENISEPAINQQKEVLLATVQLALPAAQPLPSQAPPPASSHFDAAKALITRTAALEDSLMTFNIERSALETELAKFPSGTAGRTVAERKRKKEIEQRVEVLNKEISGVRLELRKLGIR